MCSCVRSCHPGFDPEDRRHCTWRCRTTSTVDLLEGGCQFRPLDRIESHLFAPHPLPSGNRCWSPLNRMAPGVISRPVLHHRGSCDALGVISRPVLHHRGSCDARSGDSPQRSIQTANSPARRPPPPNRVSVPAPLASTQKTDVTAPGVAGPPRRSTRWRADASFGPMGGIHYLQVPVAVAPHMR